MVRRIAPSGRGAARSGLSNGQLLIALVLIAEVVFFFGLFFAFFYLRSQSPVWPPVGTPPIDRLIPSISTGLLVLSSLTLIGATVAIRRDQQQGLQIGLLLTLCLGALFLIAQVYEYSQSALTVEQGLYGSLFYTLAGFHGAHVLGGLIFSAVIFTRATFQQFSSRRMVGVAALGAYWHFVTIVWLLLFGVLYF